MRLLDRSDTSLAVALIASALVIFQRPLRYIIDAARAAELQFGIDLIPGLTVLVGAFGFHQYRKRQEAKAAARAAAAETALERARSEELERLVAFGRALGSALDPTALQQNLWRYLPSFAPDHEFWLLRWSGDRWERLLGDATTSSLRPPEELEHAAATAMSRQSLTDPHGDGVEAEGDICFAMVVGESPVGVLGVHGAVPLPSARRRALGAAAALIAIALRNVQLLAETREHSIRDSLTGCFNRGHALESLELEIRRARRTGRPLALLLFDIDHFKTVNDQHGHLAGDHILAEVGRLLARVLRVTDIKCRYGGDEFMVILPDTPMLGARPVAEALLAEIAGMKFQVEDQIVEVGASAGLAVVMSADAGALDLLARTDEALYRAKRAGRNQLAVSTLDFAPAAKTG